MNEPKLRFKADDGSQFPDWEECTINDIFKFFNGKAHENIICEDGKYIVVNSKFISTDGMVKKYTDKMIFPLKKNDIVMVMSDVPNGKAMSKCFLIDKDDKYTLNQRICCLRTKENSIFFINQISRNKYFLKFDDGIKQTNLRKNDVLSCPVFRPCLAEQQKIAEFLSTIDTVIEKQKETVSAWEERKKGVMQKLFSQEVRFKTDDGSEFPEWEEKKLGDVADVKVGEKPTLVSDNAAYEYVNAGTTNSGYVDSYNCDGDTVTTPSRGQGGIGYVGYQKHEFWLGPLCYKIKSNKDDVLTKFMYYALSFDSKKIVDLKKVGTIPAINRADLIELYMSFPCIAEQQKIADCLSSLDEVIEKQKAILAAWEELKKGLLQQMFV